MRTDASDLANLQRPVRTRVTVAAALQALATVLALAPAVAVVEIGRRLLEDPRTQVWPLAWLAVGLLAIRVLLYVAAGTLSHLADADLAVRLRHRLADQLMALPLGWFAGGASGRVTGVVQDDVATLHHAVAHARGDIASAVAGPLAIATYLFWVDWKLALPTFALLATAQSVRMRMAARTAQPVERIAAAATELSAAAVELVRGIAVVKTFARDGQPSRFGRAATAYADAEEDAQAVFVRQRSLTRATVAPATVVLLVAAAAVGLVAAGQASPVDVVAFVLLGVGLFDQLTPIYSAREQRRRAASAARRVGGLLRAPTVADVARVPEPVAMDAAPVLSVEGVWFGYTPERPVLRGIDATLRPGTLTALVGASGAGKSTLAALIARFYDVDSGAIRLDGTDIRELPRDLLYRRIGFLFQDITLLRTTVRDNIALGMPEASDAAVWAVARAAFIHERILALPRGYDSVIGEDARLSGGECQRVAIARTLLANHPVLVLDEATAYADPDSEAAVQDALTGLAAGRTLLVVAHRLYTITQADQILVMDDGRIVERGTHGKLLAADGRYAALWRAQQGDA